MREAGPHQKMGGTLSVERRKLRAWALLLTFVCSWLSACNGNVEETTSEWTAPSVTPHPTQTPTPTVYVDPDLLVELDVEEVEDEEDGTLTVYTWTNTFTNLLNEYTDVDFEVELIDINTYSTRLDQALASGEDAPDLFVCEGNIASRYIHSDNTLPLNDLGISYDEMGEMYEYSLQFAADDDNIIKAMTWELCPGAVIYNRDVAEDVLGVSEPEDVAPYFESWDAFGETATLVYDESEGDVRVVSGYDDLWRAYSGGRTSSWVVNSNLNVDPVWTDFFDLALGLYEGDLTFDTTQLDSDWLANMNNDKVLSYWGPLWLVNMIKIQDPYGHWGVVMPPEEFSWGENWMMASTSCDMKASVAQIMRDLALDEDNLIDMAGDGKFVNNMSVMADIIDSEDYQMSYLNDQNPYGIFNDVAMEIDATDVTRYEQSFNDEFLNIVALYVEGEFASKDDAEAEFETIVTELGLV